MMDWKKELDAIFADPLLADVTAPTKSATSSDRLIAGFQAISDYFETNGRLPDEASNSKLYHNFRGILSSKNKIDKCRPFDKFGILPPKDNPQIAVLRESKCEYGSEQSTKEESLEDILKDPLFSDIMSGNNNDIFDVPQYMKDRLAARKEVDYIGKRVPCEDFENFETGFEAVHTGLKTGKYKLVKFSVKHLQVGQYFVEDGVIGYLAAFADEGSNAHGERDGRTRVVYENGMESDIKYKTITKNLSVTGYSIIDYSMITDEEFKQRFTLSDNDVESGIIYVLRSKSTLPEIAAINNLHKIGFTTTSLEHRIANAHNELTYLCADVEVVATWKVYNVKSSTFESMIHKLFDCVQLQLTVDGHHPKEWFIVPFKVIEEAITAIIAGKPIEYNQQFQQIIYK